MYYKLFVYLVHILFMGPLLIYIGLYHDDAGTINNKTLWDSIYILGIITIIYHIYLSLQFYGIIKL